MSMVCPSWLSFILYNPLRKAFTDRQKILDESGVGQDSVVLEVGAGNGFISEAIAGRARRLVAVELQEGMVRKLRRRLAKFGDRAEIVLSDAATAPVPDGSCDVCIMYYSFHEIADKSGAIRTVWRALKTGGFLAIYEPTVEVSEGDMERTVAMFDQKGFVEETGWSSRFTRFALLRRRDA